MTAIVEGLFVLGLAGLLVAALGALELLDRLTRPRPPAEDREP